MTEAQCRAIVWDRDEGKDRATGIPVYRAHECLNLQHLGEVHHLKGRRVMPEWKKDPDRQVLLSHAHHELATGTWGGKLLKLLDPDDPTMPATDARKPILFVRVDKHGTELWRTIR